jgi:hypothetical protein
MNDNPMHLDFSGSVRIDTLIRDHTDHEFSLEAVPDVGSVFGGWSGAIGSPDSTIPMRIGRTATHQEDFPVKKTRG